MVFLQYKYVKYSYLGLNLLPPSFSCIALVLVFLYITFGTNFR